MNLNRLSLLLLATAAGVAGCRLPGPTFGGPPPPPAPTPSISSLSPASVTAGSAGFTLTVNGSNFISGADLVWRNPDNPEFVGGEVTVVNSTQVTLQIPAGAIAVPGSAQLFIFNPNSPDSNPVTFPISPGPPGGAQAISVGANGASPNGSSHDPVLSFNGRFVAFASEATNLITPSANFPEGYVRDTCLGAIGPPTCTPSTLLVSAINGGAAASPVEGNGQGGATPSFGSQSFTTGSGGIGPAGRFVGFLSTATNLVAPNTTSQQAYVRDNCFPSITGSSCAPATVLASVTETGGQPNGPASAFFFASNTCRAAFVSAGTDLVSGVTTPNEIYVASCSTSGVTGGFNSTTLVSASTSSVPGDQGSQQPAISSDGRFVAFASTSTNLTSAPNLGFQQIYVRDACLQASSGCSPSTLMVSVDNAGNPLVGNSQLPAISDDGRFVVFTAQTPAAGGGLTSEVMSHDTCTGSSGPVMNCAPSTTTISVAADGSAANGPSNSTAHAISGNGRFVVFSSSATNLIAGGNPGAQVFVRDTCNSPGGSVSGCTPSTVLVSLESAGPIGGFDAAISDDGHFVVFVNETLGPVQQILLAATGF